MALPNLQPTSPWDEVYDFLTSSPTPEQIIAFKPSEQLQMRVRELLEKNNRQRLSANENAEIDELERINHFVSNLKIKARQKQTL